MCPEKSLLVLLVEPESAQLCKTGHFPPNPHADLPHLCLGFPPEHLSDLVHTRSQEIVVVSARCFWRSVVMSLVSFLCAQREQCELFSERQERPGRSAWLRRCFRCILKNLGAFWGCFSDTMSVALKPSQCSQSTDQQH